MTNNLALAVHLSLLATQLLFHSASPFPTNNQIHITCTITLVVATHLVGPVSEKPADTQPYTILWPFWLGTIENCITAGHDLVEEHYWRTDRSPTEATCMTAFAPKKLGWATRLLLNSRLVGWNHQARNVPPPRAGGRREFVLSQTFNFVKLLLATDLVLQLSVRLFSRAEDGSNNVDIRALTIWNGGLIRSLLKATLFGAGLYFFMHIQYVVVSVVSVLTGLSEPRVSLARITISSAYSTEKCMQYWPPLFGNINEATTVRNFWGTFWHQSIRRVSTHAHLQAPSPVRRLISRHSL
jgi:hypothetical protein